MAFSGWTIFPEKTKETIHQVGIGPGDLPFSTFKGPAGSPTQGIMPQVVGCVDYQFAFEQGHHQTGFIFEIRGPDEIHLGKHREFTIPKEKLGIYEGGVTGGLEAN